MLCQIELGASGIYPHGFSVADVRGRSDHGCDYLQYVPLVSPWVLKAAGVKTRSGWGQMAVSQGVASIFMIGSVKGLKNIVSSVRPDGTDDDSFPSGHAAWAFMGATMMARELGCQSAWYTVLACALATGVAVERAVDMHHYPTDIVAGAAIGVVAAQLGYLIGDVIFGRQPTELRVRDCDEVNRPYLSVSTGLSLPLGSIRGDNVRIERLPALRASLIGGIPVSRLWGISVDLGMSSMPIAVAANARRTFVKPLTSLEASAGVYFQNPLTRVVDFIAGMSAGYRYNLPLHAIDRVVRWGDASPLVNVGAGCILRFSPQFFTAVSAGYEMSAYRIKFAPSSLYDVSDYSSTHGLGSALRVVVSSRYEF